MLPPAVRCLDSLRMWRSSKKCIVEGIKRSNNMCGSRNFKRGRGGGGVSGNFLQKGGSGKRSKYLGQYPGQFV